MCLCVFNFSDTTEPTKVKIHLAPPWNMGGKFIQMIQVVFCFLFFILILTASGGGGGGFCGDFTTNLARQSRVISGALKTENLKALLFPGPNGAGATNDW